MLSTKNLHVMVSGKEVVRGLNIEISPGEIHVVMGPNGSGKSSLSYALAGHPYYEVTKGSVSLDGIDILSLSPAERAKTGLFLAFQNPVTVPGVPVRQLLRRAAENLHPEIPIKTIKGFNENLERVAGQLGLSEEYLKRSVNDGFSGGEKKRLESLQLLTLKPKYALVDEIDSGLDIDSVKLVAKALNQVADAGVGILLITHYRRILDHLSPTTVHVMVRGRLAESGSVELLEELERDGYRRFASN